MQDLVCRAQNDEQAAIDELCQIFKPLIYSEAKRQTVYNVLGEDAVNTAWIIFLNFIKRYKGNNYASLPGMLQCVLYYELLHTMKKEICVYDNEFNSEEVLENQSCDVIEENFNNMVVKEGLRALPPKQWQLLEMYYVQDKNHRQIAKVLGCSERHVKRLKRLAIDNLRSKLQA